MSFAINVTYDPSVNRAPSSFKSAVNSVVHFFESHFSNPVALNIAVGYGEIGGHRLSSGALGQSSYNLTSYSYSDLTTAVANHAASADDRTAVANLPSYDPTGGTYWATQAQAKALGLMGPSNSLDGFIGFAAGNKFAYNTSHGGVAGHYDFFGVVAHEISEVMGRCLLVGQSIGFGSTSKGYSLLDLFHYSSAVKPDFIGTKPGYFSIDGGHTNLANFNTQAGGDFGDWATSAGKDGFRAFAPPGVVNAVSLTDLRELDVLGWDRTNNSLAPAQHAKPHHVHGHSSHHRVVGSHANASEAGADQFIFRTPNDGATNTASNFSQAQVDKIDAAHAILAALGKAGAGSHIDPRDSHASPTGSAHFSTDHQNERTGALFHDPDGAGHAAAMQFATVHGHLNFAASDFLIG